MDKAVKYFFVFLVLQSGCTEPRVVAREIGPLATVSGSVLVQLPESAVCGHTEYRGLVSVGLFPVDQPDLLPVIDIIAEETLFSSDAVLEDGVLEAPFLFPNVVPGRYSLVGILDGDRNINIFVENLAQPTSGDLVGAYFSLGDPSNILDVTEPASYEQITVPIGLSVSVEPPVFRVVAPTINLAEGGNLIIDRPSIAGLQYQVECDFFAVTAVEGTGDQDVNNDGQVIYPRVTLTQIDGEGRSINGEINISNFDALPIEVQSFSVVLPTNTPSGVYSIRLDTIDGRSWTVPNSVPLAVPGVTSALGQDSPVVIQNN